MKTRAIIFLLFCGLSFAKAQLIKNNFLSGTTLGEWTLEQYPDRGATFKEYTWKEANKTNADGPLSIVNSLLYPNYIESGKGNAIKLSNLSNSTRRVFGYALADNNKYISGTYYLAFLVQGHKKTIAGNHVAILTLDGRYYLTYQRVAVLIKATEDRKAFQLGVAGSEADTQTCVYAPEVLDLDKTYLVVLKYNMDNGNIDLFVNPQINQKEPKMAQASANNSDLVATSAGIRSITLKQRTNHSVTLGGFRFAKSWKAAIGLE